MSARRSSSIAAAGLLASLAIAVGIASAAATAEEAPPRPAAPSSTATVTAIAREANAHGLSDTRCSVCHTVNGWSEVRFDHNQTGFVLRGAHAKASCSGCHGADLSRAVPQSCTACHRDAHAGEFGARCQGCHEETSWKPLFTADAHRRTNFPLTGRHATIPCEECHVNQRDRSFTRATVACIACHQQDYARTGAVSIDHASAGFGTSCRDCHLPFRWQGAHFAEHATCFEINAGPHANISCSACHTSLPNVAAAHGACDTKTASCTRCHACASMSQIHKNLLDSFQCKDSKCYECHRFTAAQSQRAPPSRGFR